MKIQRVWLLVPAIVLLAGCTSGGSAEDWSRSYVGPYDRVMEAVIDVLEDEGYLVDADREKGRVTAEPSRSRGGGLVSLVVRVQPRGELILVDVLTRGGASYSNAPARPQDTFVLEFFHELELRLEGLRD